MMREKIWAKSQYSDRKRPREGPMEKVYTANDCGCWIDCAYGPEHARDKLADMLKECRAYAPLDTQRTIDEICEQLTKSMSDDDWETDAGTDLLNEYTAEGLVWIWDAGDLILTTDDPDALFP